MPFLLLKDVLDEMSLPVKPFVADSGRGFLSQDGAVRQAGTSATRELGVELRF